MICIWHYIILCFSILFQLVSAFLALKLIKITKQHVGWIMIASANLFMIYRRVISFILLHCEARKIIFSSELAGLVISILMFLGIAFTKSYFEEIIEGRKKLYKSQQNLEKINRSKDRLFSIISHDLKNPFNTILNFSQILMENYNNLDSDEIHDFIRRIYKSGKGGYYLLENLLLWSRFQTGTIDIKMEKLNLNVLVEENILFLIENANIKGIKFANKMKDHSFIHADKNMISTVIRNLLSNAIKFTNRGGTITIYTEEREKEIVLNIEDTGTGLTPKEVESLFDLETNTSKPGTDKEQGSGLGLVICREFIHQNKGRIGVKSEKGKGSTFSICLPFRQGEK